MTNLHDLEEMNRCACVHDKFTRYGFDNQCRMESKKKACDKTCAQVAGGLDSNTVHHADLPECRGLVKWRRKNNKNEGDKMLWTINTPM